MLLDLRWGRWKAKEGNHESLWWYPFPAVHDLPVQGPLFASSNHRSGVPPKKMHIGSSVPAGFYFYWIMQLSASSLLTLPDCLWLATCDLSSRTALFSWTKPNVLPTTATVKARSKRQRQSCWMWRMTLILVAGQGPRPKRKPKQKVPANHLTHNSARHRWEALVPFQKQNISS